jgi:hypothetical protein
MFHRFCHKKLGGSNGSNGSCTFSLKNQSIEAGSAIRTQPEKARSSECAQNFTSHDFVIYQTLQLGCHGRAASCSADQLLSHCKGKHVFHLFLMDTKSASTGMTS